MDTIDWWNLGAKTVVALSPVFLAILSWVSVQAGQFITAKVKNEYLRGVLLRLDDAASVAVREVEQVVVAELKRASDDGALTLEERRKVKEAAIEAVRSYLGAKGLVEAGRVLGVHNGDLDRALAARVEAALFDLKVKHGKLNGAYG